jgi:peptidoglycan/LPS O-acetylase OafA/YrhL
VLSGFMMIYASRNMAGGVGDAMKFFRRRYLRITPTYWMFTFLMLAAMAFAGHEVNHFADRALPCAGVAVLHSGSGADG